LKKIIVHNSNQTQQPHKRTLTQNQAIKIKKVIFTLVAISCLFVLGICSASASTIVGAIDYSNFISKAATALKAVIILIGAGLGVWGVVNLIEGYGNDNPGAKSQGMKQLMAGIGLIVVGVLLVPVLQNMMSSAMS
jgi:hypothetical protein